MNIESIRNQFPILQEEVNGHPLVYFDNAATTQKPASVISAISNYYSTTNANIHRGIHYLAEKATRVYEETRKTAAKFVNAKSTEEIIFTAGTTEGINLVAHSLGQFALSEGDEVIISTMEHHSNIVPWQFACQKAGATLRIIPINDQGEILLDEYEKLLTENTKIVSICHASNTLGTVNPVNKIVQMAQAVGAYTVLDGAQAASHLEIDVQELGVDFYAFSAHKMYGPTGTGILYGRKELLENIPPYQGGGEMIAEVSFENTTYADLPHKFEAGTPNIADVIAFDKAFEFVNQVGKEAIHKHELDLHNYGTQLLSKIDGLKFIGTASNKVGVISFVIEGVHHQDIGIMLDTEGIAIRTGHHCTQPLMKRCDILGTNRASFGVYNTREEIDRFYAGLTKILKILR